MNQNPSQNAIRKVRRAALLVSLLVSVTQIQAQTQVATNAQARAEVLKVDAEFNKTYEALSNKLRMLEETKAKRKPAIMAGLLRC
jgi:uncharacterized protein YecT (DUF1311 family)